MTEAPRSRGEIGSWPRPNHAGALSVHPSSANLLVDLPLTTSAVVSTSTNGAHIASHRQHTFCAKGMVAPSFPSRSAHPARLRGLHNKNEEGSSPRLLVLFCSRNGHPSIARKESNGYLGALEHWSHSLHVCFPLSDPFAECGTGCALAGSLRDS